MFEIIAVIAVILALAIAAVLILAATKPDTFSVRREIDIKSPVYQRGYEAGTVAMANAGPNTNGSQFFIMHVDYPLPPSYSIFGRVTEGQEVVDAIASSPRDRNDRPNSEVKMEKVTIEGA